MPLTPAEKSRRYRQRNADRYRQAQRDRRRADPGKAHDETRNARYRRMGVFVETVRVDVLMERDGGICGICHERITDGTETIDHVISTMNGGEHSYANTQPAHLWCNQVKGPY